jgi:hypothetical protein
VTVTVQQLKVVLAWEACSERRSDWTKTLAMDVVRKKAVALGVHGIKAD